MPFRNRAAIAWAASSRRTIAVLAMAGAAIFAGQVGRGLMNMDDCREVEIAREILETGDCVVPHLAGLPFVEKPPGFELALAAGFRVRGEPSLAIARLVTAAVACLAVVATFLLGRSLQGPGGGTTAAALLALSPLFLRTCHTVLLDNALVAACAFALYFTWLGLSSADPGRKRRAYVLAGFATGVSFLMKGLVGPAILGSGILLYLGLSERWKELRHLLGPGPMLAFLLPVLPWLVPFLIVAPQGLVWEFLVDNHVGRFVHAYESHVRPAYYYFLTLAFCFAPGAVLFPQAVRAAWRDRREPRGQGALFALAASVGPLALLSLSRAKDAVYLLPVYPAFAILASGALVRATRSAGKLDKVGPCLLIALSAGAAGAAITATAWFEGRWAGIYVAATAAVASAISLGIALRRRDPARIGLSTATLWTIASVLYFTGPIARHQAGRDEWRPPVYEMARISRERALYLLRPDDTLRGAMGFLRGRSACETRSSGELLDALVRSREAAAVVRNDGKILDDLFGEAHSRRLELIEEARAPYPGGKALFLISAVPAGGTHVPKAR